MVGGSILTRNVIEFWTGARTADIRATFGSYNYGIEYSVPSNSLEVCTVKVE